MPKTLINKDSGKEQNSFFDVTVVKSVVSPMGLLFYSTTLYVEQSNPFSQYLLPDWSKNFSRGTKLRLHTYELTLEVLAFQEFDDFGNCLSSIVLPGLDVHCKEDRTLRENYEFVEALGVPNWGERSI